MGCHISCLKRWYIFCALISLADVSELFKHYGHNLFEKHGPYDFVCSHCMLHSNRSHAENFMYCTRFWEHQYPLLLLFTFLLNANHSLCEKNTSFCICILSSPNFVSNYFTLLCIILYGTLNVWYFLQSF